MALNDTIRLPEADNLIFPAEEQPVFESTDNVVLNMASGAGYPGSTGTYIIGKGKVILTNLNIYYLSVPSLHTFRVLRVPLVNIGSLNLQPPAIGVWRTVQSWITGAPEISRKGEANEKQVKRSLSFVAYPASDMASRLAEGTALAQPATITLEFANGRDAFTVSASCQQLGARRAEDYKLPPAYY